MTTVAEILAKIANKTATTEELAGLPALYTSELEAEKKAETAYNALIKKIEEAKIAPAKLYADLVAKNLISVPTVAPAGKIYLSEEAVKTSNGTASTFKLWKGREVKKLTADAKKYWEDIKKKGQEHFLTTLTVDGNAYIETDEGKEWLKALFAK